VTPLTPTARTPDLTASAPAAEPGAGGPRHTLARCVGDVPHFLDEHWGRRSHLHRGGDRRDLLTLADVDHLLTSTALRQPAFRLVKGGETLPASRCTRTARVGSREISDLIDVAKVHREVAEGATAVLQGVHRYWPPVTQLCRALEDELTHPVQANAYVTPPVAQGLRIHADAHDVFAIQTFGRKHWVVYDGPGRPLPDPADPPDRDVVLEPGDCLYLPTGTPHAARTIDSPSIHLTIGVRPQTWSTVVRRAVAAAITELDGPLPAGYARNPEQLEAGLKERLAALAGRLAELDTSAMAQAAATGFWAGRTPPRTGHLRDLLDPPVISDDTEVHRSPGAVSHLVPGTARVRLVMGDRELLLPTAAEPALRRLVTHDRMRVRDLADLLDEDSRVVLVRRLVREGLLVVGG
jgi:bifunctional lysine-specific demethylase and histidyl-hydroxylase NO66